MNDILEVKNVSKHFRAFSLNEVTFALPRGYIMGLIGPNGAGKSTIIKLLTNLISLDNGSITIFGLDNIENEEEIKDRIGYVGEEQYFYEDKKVIWIEKFISSFYKKWDSDKFYSLLKKFNVEKNKKVKELSKGMKVKLSIALALAHDPELLILDEPTSGLDTIIREEILDILLDVIQDENKSVLLSSHITEDIEKVADYVTYIVDGNIVLSEEKESILSNYKKVYLKDENSNKEILKNLKCIQKNNFGISGITNDYIKLKNEIDNSLKKDHIKVENIKLDEVLKSFIKGA